MKKRMVAGASIALAALSGANVASGGAAGAQSSDARQEPTGARSQCLAEALTAKQLDAGVEAKIECFETFGEVARELGYTGADAKTVTPSAFLNDSRYAAAASSVLAVHANSIGAGSPGTLTISGSDCNGGGLPLTGGWANRVDSTTHHLCNTIKHYDTASYGGTMEQTQGPGTKYLTTLIEAAESVKYYQ